jgi:hypothetical protein
MLWLQIVISLVQGMLGSFMLSMYAGQSYQADLYVNKAELTLRMNIVSVARQCGLALGTLLHPVLLTCLQAHS